MDRSTRTFFLALAVNTALACAVLPYNARSAPAEEPGLRTHLLALSRAKDAEQVAAASVTTSWANVQRALAEGQPEARLWSLTATWRQARREAERAAREVAEAESEVVGALGVRRAEP